MKRTATVVLLGIALGHAASDPPPADPRAPESGLVETERVDAVLDWPFVVEAKKARDDAACRALDPADVRVVEDGRDAHVIAVDRAGPLGTHVLLLDTSASMSDPLRFSTRRKFRQTKTAARTYAEWMHEDGERASLVVFGFDDDLIMHAPPTALTDAGRLAEVQRRIDAMVGGYGTAVHDAAAAVIDYLSDLDHRSVVVLLSDGADSASLASAAEVERLLEREERLTMFAIGVDLSRGPHQSLLERLTAASGGKYFWLRNMKPSSLNDPLVRRFADIRERLRKQLYVTFDALPYGHSPGDRRRADEDGFVWRPLRIESRDPRCRVLDDGYRSRRTLAPPAAGKPARETLEIQRARQGDSWLARWAFPDIVRDDNPLVRYSPRKHRLQREMRSIRLAVPAFTQREPRRPEQIVHRWLVDGWIPASPTPGRPPLALRNDLPLARQINGKSFLELREQLAAVVMHVDPAYEGWAQGKLEWQIRTRLGPRISNPAELEAVVQAQLEQATARTYRRYLARWLGDVDARELAFAIETLAADPLLDGGEAARGEAALVQQRWLALHDWLPYPDRNRVTVPLELTCQAAGEACGFYRIVLPRLALLPGDAARPSQTITIPTTPREVRTFDAAKVPRYPFGLMTVRWLLADAELAAALAGWRCASIHHERITTDGAEDCASAVTLHMLGPQGDETSIDLHVTAVRPDGEPPGSDPPFVGCGYGDVAVRLEPRCVMRIVDTPPALARRLAARGVPACP